MKSSHYPVTSAVVVPASVLAFLPAGDCLTTNSLLQLSTLNSTDITSRHESLRKHRSSVAVSSCEAITQQRLLRICLSRGRCLATGLHAATL
jgi:hypothetical protein